MSGGERAERRQRGEGADVAQPAARRAVFLDKDGTLIVDVPYNVDPALVRPVPEAPEALRMLHDAGFVLFVITNQS